MRCTRVEKFLPLYVAGDLAGRRAERHVINHLATCERCRCLAEEYDASRNLVRDAATLPPDFDGAFYEEIRRSVLAEITRERPRLAPPMSLGFASLFNARFAYAASLALIIATVAALSLHSYFGRKSEETAHRDMNANVNRERTGTPATTGTPISTQAKGDERQTLSPVNEIAGENTSGGSQQGAKPSSLKRRSHNGNAQNDPQRSVNLAKHTPPHVKRNPRAPNVAATVEHAEQIASSSGGSATTDAPEVSRIEIQTSDPNIRIIWLSPGPDAVAQPLK